MRLTTLGTSCAQQTLTRTQCCNAISLSPTTTYLFDCGSAAVTNLLQSGIKLASIQKIFITHLHTDHVIGLPGLLTDILSGHGGTIVDFEAGVERDSGTSGRKTVDVYGPSGLKELLRTTFAVTYTMLASSFRVHELLFRGDRVNGSDPFVREEGSRDLFIEEVSSSSSSSSSSSQNNDKDKGNGMGIWRNISEDHNVTVSAVPIKHTVPCLGYILTEGDTRQAIPASYIQALRAVHKPGSQAYSSAIRSLKQGDPLDLRDSASSSASSPTTTLNAAATSTPSASTTTNSSASALASTLFFPALKREKGRTVIVLGDTSDATSVLKYVPTSSIDLLIHESTNAYFPLLLPVNSTGFGDGSSSASAASQSLASVRQKAAGRGHATPEVAGSLARRLGARTLVLTHFSSRYSGSGARGAVGVMRWFERLATLADAVLDVDGVGNGLRHGGEDAVREMYAIHLAELKHHDDGEPAPKKAARVTGSGRAQKDMRGETKGQEKDGGDGEGGGHGGGKGHPSLDALDATKRFTGQVVAAWDGMWIDIPKPGILI